MTGQLFIDGLKCRTATTPLTPVAKRRLITLVGVLLVFAAGGCQLQAQSKYNAAAQQNVADSQEQFRLRVRSMVDPICGQIAHDADAIIAGTNDHNVQMAALTWEIEAVPAMREALYQP